MGQKKLPSPNQNEDRDAFVSRCMSNGTMKEEFPDTEQRVAVCMNIWREEHKDMSDSLLEAILARKQKQTQFGYGILTADRWVQTLKDAAGLAICYQYASQGQTSFDDVLRKAARTLTYSNPEMIVLEKQLVETGSIPSGVELPKNTLMVFKHILTTPKEDRDNDILRTEGAIVDPKMLLLWQHVHTLPIGKMLAVTEHTKDRLQLISCIIDMNELCHDAAVMVDNDMGRFSHGFKALSWEPRKSEKGDDIDGFDVKSFEVMEESLVSVPSNTDAASEEVILSLVENGKLTSGLMKEVGKTIREHRNIQITGVELEDERQEEKDEHCTEAEAEQTGAGTPEKADGDEGPEEIIACDKEVDDGVIVIDVSPEIPAEEKTGRSLSAKTLSVLKECLDDMRELLEKGYEMSRGGAAICERCVLRLSKVIEDADTSAEADRQVQQITVKEAMALVAAEATREQRDRLEYILRAIRESEEKRKRAERFRQFRHGRQPMSS